MSNSWAAGIHSQAFVVSNIERSTTFLSDVLGLRLVKRTVHDHDPRLPVRHFDFGSDRQGGAHITLIEWNPIFYAIPSSGFFTAADTRAALDAPRVGAAMGRWGSGTNHHLALHVASRTELLMWKSYLGTRGIHVTGPYFRNYFNAIYFRDPDGAIFEIATTEPGFLYDEEVLGSTHQEAKPGAMTGARSELDVAEESWDQEVTERTPEMALLGFHHNTSVSSDIERTTEFLTEQVGIDLIKRTDYLDQAGATHFYYKAAPQVEDSAILTFFGFPGHERGRLGVGLSHHIALVAKDADAVAEWRQDLLAKGIDVTEVEDGSYFRSASFRDPDGHILQIATPADFSSDEDADSLGRRLCLPEELESERASIERFHRDRPAPTPAVAAS